VVPGRALHAAHLRLRLIGTVLASVGALIDTVNSSSTRAHLRRQASQRQRQHLSIGPKKVGWSSAPRARTHTSTVYLKPPSKSGGSRPSCRGVIFSVHLGPKFSLPVASVIHHRPPTGKSGFCVFCRDKNPVVLPVREPKPGFFFRSGIPESQLKTDRGRDRISQQWPAASTASS
jgi:hypothetical protein